MIVVTNKECERCDNCVLTGSVAELVAVVVTYVNKINHHHIRRDHDRDETSRSNLPVIAVSFTLDYLNFSRVQFVVQARISNTSSSLSCFSQLNTRINLEFHSFLNSLMLLPGIKLPLNSRLSWQDTGDLTLNIFVHACEEWYGDSWWYTHVYSLRDRCGVCVDLLIDSQGGRYSEYTACFIPVQRLRMCIIAYCNMCIGHRSFYQWRHIWQFSAFHILRRNYFESDNFLMKVRLLQYTNHIRDEDRMVI